MSIPRAFILGLLLVPSCGRGEDRSPEMESYLLAVEKQNSGSFESALSDYRALLKNCEDRTIRARAELGLAQIETAFEQRDRALKRLQELPKEVDRRTLHSVAEQIDGILHSFTGTPFETEVRGAALAARNAAEDRRREIKKVEKDVAVNLMDRGDFNAALEYLRQVESEQVPDDLRDIAELLAMVRLRSEARADEVLSKARKLAPTDPVRAAAILDEAVPKYVGTRAHARLLKERMALANQVPLSDSKQTDGGQERGKSGG
ncbi:MAG: hypothetical protein V2A76_03705 [Planctomycetota bacterium]